MSNKKICEPAGIPPIETPSHYIGIGASAGGLEALQIFLQHVPSNTGACFIVVQHLSSDFESMMLELLSKHTSMTIHNVVDGMVVKPNEIYLIPPQKNMMVDKGRLLLSDKTSDSGLSFPIDRFFCSLAEDQQHKAIGIILSGTGSDGSRGIKALKEAGALVLAQDPESAKFDGMPSSAVNTGSVDLILRVECMGEQLESYIRHPLVSGKASDLKEVMFDGEGIMDDIFGLLKVESEIDFAKYKPSTVARRIERRMTIRQVTALQEYLTLLFKDASEIQVLNKDLLIGVTCFFRDDDAFSDLKEAVIPNIVKQSKEDAPIRVWVAGCSTGEEAYSIAILFACELEKQNLKRLVKVFATDVNGDSITGASNGKYREEIQHDIPAHILTRYFTKISANAYQVNKDIRQMVIFATHNIIANSPFSNMDLVSCRNILIYFQHGVQKRVLTSLHFSLRKEGYLFLGASESLGDLAPHFEAVNERNRIYRKRSNIRIPISTTPPTSAVSHVSSQSIPSVSRLMRGYRGVSAPGSAVSFANEALITRYAPPCILLNEDQEAIHVYGDVSNYVRRLPPGRISVNINDMINEDISIAVSSALHRAQQFSEDVCYKNIVTKTQDQTVVLNLRVRYIKEHQLDTSPGYYWLIFESCNELDRQSLVASVPFDATEQSRQRIEDLELELRRSKEHLQVTVEELETTNEELRASNEELMSANEELQSTNEELQSVNEELYTVNSEFQEKIAEISQANNDLDEVLSLSRIGIIFLDENMLIRRYTHAVSEYINVLETDVNRPLYHISKNIQYDNMLADVSRVFDGGDAINNELMLPDKRMLRISVHRYNYADMAQSHGVAITFSDISKVKYTEKGLDVAYTQLRGSINNALEVLDTAEFLSEVRVLIVDDQPVDLVVLNSELDKITAFSTKIFQATSVSSALNLIQKNSVDVCLTDYNLEGETAIDLIEAFKREGVHTPVIVLTGGAEDKLKAMLLSHGVLDLISKQDITPQLLSRSIRYAIRRSQIDDQIDKVIDTASNREKTAVPDS